VVGEQEHESNERKPPPRKPLVSRILCAFKCQYHRFTQPSKNGETENQKNERTMMARWKGRVGIRPERSRKNPAVPTAKPIGTMPDPLGPLA
jgi:hypothetical protein